jgi:hypothetical protein
MTTPEALPAYAAHVYAADAFWVVSGANQGDAISEADRVEPGDVYRIDPSVPPIRLLLRPSGEGTARQIIAAGSVLGAVGDEIELRSLLTFMAPDGERIEVLLLRHPVEGYFALPLSPITPRADYTLVDARHDPGMVRIADIVCVSFVAGTLITLAGGAQRPIEALRAGDLVLTRDSGAQPVRWIGKATMRAIGSFAPVVIAAGTLGNGADLIVSPHHRIFLYQRGERRMAGMTEVLVQAKHLVDGDAVRRREGGFVDYFSLVFDGHEIIYAEGIAAESLMVNEATLTVLPDATVEELRARFPGLSQRQHYGTEIGRKAVEDGGRATIFRKG